MNNPLVLIAVSLVAVLLAWTLRSIRTNLMRRPFSRSVPVGLQFVQILENVLKTGSLLAILAVIPHPVALVLLLMLVSAIVIEGKQRYDEEARSLNRWVRAGVHTATSIPVLVESLGDGYSSKVGRRAKSFAYRIGRGETVLDAARRSRLPLDANSLALISIPAATQDESINSFHRPSDTDNTDSSLLRSAIPQQFVYVVVLVVLAYAIGMFIRTYVILQIERISSEFSMEIERLRLPLDIATDVGDGIVLGLGIWLILVALNRRWAPYWLIRGTPWFGRWSIDRGRLEVLTTLARGIRVGQPASQILRFAEQSTKYRWIRKRCRNAQEQIESGVSLPRALRAANLVSTRQKTWLESAEANRHLADAIEQLIHSSRRRESLLWNLRAAWVVPLAIVAVGAYVLIHAIYFFYILFHLIKVSA